MSAEIFSDKVSRKNPKPRSFGSKYWKPDGLMLISFENEPLHKKNLNPLFHFSQKNPHFFLENTHISLALSRETFQRLRNKFINYYWRSRQTHIDMHRGDQLGECQDRGTGTKMDTTEVP